MVSVNSLTAFCFLFKNVYFTLQKYYNHQSGLPFFRFFSHISVHESMFLKNTSFLQKILGIADYGREGGKLFFFLDSQMSVWELEKWYHKSSLKQLPLSPLYCNTTNVGLSALTQALINASVSPLRAQLNELIRILLPVYAHYFPSGYLMGCSISGKYR